MKKVELEARFLKALAHPVRLDIVKKLKAGSRCVCELFDESEFSQPNVSQHLRILKDAGVLESHKDGNRTIYGIKHDKITRLLELAGEITKTELRSLLEE